MAEYQKPIKVLVVDDSLFMRTLISNLIEEHPGFLIVGVARDGYDAIEKVHLLQPDVVTLDLEMPRLDGLSALGYIMSECPTPVVVVSGLIGKSQELTMKALDFGAVDFVAKPAGPISLNMRTVKDELIAKLQMAVHVDLKKLPVLMAPHEEHQQLTPAPRSTYLDAPLVIIGASTGGPRAVAHVIEHLPKAAYNASFLVVQHMPIGFTSQFAKRLDQLSPVHFHEAEEGDILSAGNGLVAPAGRHLLLNRNETRLTVYFDDGPKEHGVKPALNVTLRSIAKLSLSKTICVVLTGMGSDGADGCRSIKEAGAHIIVQDEQTSVVFGMPGAAIKTGCVDIVAALDDIPAEINRFL